MSFYPTLGFRFGFKLWNLSLVWSEFVTVTYYSPYFFILVHVLFLLWTESLCSFIFFTLIFSSQNIECKATGIWFKTALHTWAHRSLKLPSVALLDRGERERTSHPKSRAGSGFKLCCLIVAQTRFCCFSNMHLLSVCQNILLFRECRKWTSCLVNIMWWEELDAVADKPNVVWWLLQFYFDERTYQS